MAPASGWFIAHKTIPTYQRIEILLSIFFVFGHFFLSFSFFLSDQTLVLCCSWTHPPHREAESPVDSAVVGESSPGDNRHIVGSQGCGKRNDRGRVLMDWAHAEPLMVLNTKFRKPFAKQWTHLQAGHKRVINCWLLEKCRWLMVKDVEAGYTLESIIGALL